MARGVNKVIIVGLYVSGMSLTQVSEKTGVSISTVRARVREAGELRSRTEGLALAREQGRAGWDAVKGRKRQFSEQWIANMRASAIKRGRERRRGWSKNQHGYIDVTAGEHKGRRLHRVIAEEKIGRRLTPSEHVHHINRNREDNRPENLAVLPASEHMSLHAKENSKGRKRDSLGRFA